MTALRAILVLSLALALSLPAGAQTLDESLSIEDVGQRASTMADAALLAEVTAWEGLLTEAQEAAALADTDAEGEPEGETEKKDAAAAANTRIDDIAQRMLVLVDAASDRKLDVASQRAVLIEVMGLDAARADLNAFGSLLQSWVDRGHAWLADEAPGIAVKVIAGLLLLLVFKILANVASGIIGRSLKHSKLSVSPLLNKFFVGLASKVVMVVGTLLALSTVGIDLGPILAGVGIVGFVVGFALQDTLANFAAGVMILLYRPFDVGDYVDVSGVSGEVTDLNLVSTKLHTLDNQVILIPNGSVWGGTIVNRTALPKRRCDITMGIAYTDDIDKAVRVFSEVLDANEGVLADPAFDIVMDSLGDSSVNLTVRPWVKTSSYLGMKSELTKQLKQACDANGLTIPFPQRDVHLFNEA